MDVEKRLQEVHEKIRANRALKLRVAKENKNLEAELMAIATYIGIEKDSEYDLCEFALKCSEKINASAPS